MRSEIAAILPGVQVIEKESQALARAEARTEAGRVAAANREAWLEGRENLRSQRQALTGRLLAIVALVAAAVLAYLALANVRERAREIALLRSLGLGSARVILAVLARCALIGLVGALLGCLLAVAAAGISPHLELPTLGELAIAVALATVLALAAGWLPALSVVRLEPARVLRGELN